MSTANEEAVTPSKTEAEKAEEVISIPTSTKAPHHLNEEETQAVKNKALELLPQFRETLGDIAKDVSDENLLKFLHWKPNLTRATERFQAHINWRSKNTTFFDSDPLLLASQDPLLQKHLCEEIIVAPPGMSDKYGNAVVVGRLRNNNMRDGRTPKDVARMLVYTLDRVLERENAQINGVTVFHDLRGLGPSNVHPSIPKILFGAIIGNMPIRVQAIYIWNAPMFFWGFFKIVSIFMPQKIKQRIHLVKDLSEVPIEPDEFLVEHGGKREYNSKEWVEAQIQREKNGSISTFGSIPIA